MLNDIDELWKKLRQTKYQYYKLKNKNNDNNRNTLKIDDDDDEDNDDATIQNGPDDIELDLYKLLPGLVSHKTESSLDSGNSSAKSNENENGKKNGKRKAEDLLDVPAFGTIFGLDY